MTSTTSAPSPAGPALAPQRLVLAVLAAGALFHLANWSVSFSGDAEIHLAFAEQLLQGCFLCFNPAEPSGGETSLGYLLLVGAFAKLLGLAYAPLAMKATGLLSMLGLAAATHRLSRNLGADPFLSTAAALASLNLVGSVSQGLSGTENALFAALFVFFTARLVASGFFDPQQTPSLASDILTGFLAGALFWLRPEIAPCLMLVWAVRVVLTLAASRDWGVLRGLTLASGACMAAFALPVAACLFAAHAASGLTPFGAGMIRRLMSIFHDSLAVGPLWLNLKVAKRMAAYAPLVLAVPVAVWLALARWSDEGARGRVLGLAATVMGCLGLYLVNVLPAFHLARYTIFLWPLALALATWVLPRLLVRSERWRHAICAGLAIHLLGLAVAETLLRTQAQGSLIELLKPEGGARFKTPQLLAAIRAPAQRAAFSEALLAALGSPPQRPVVVSQQEVQIRRRLDSRFVVRAYDGVTDPKLIDYIHAGYFDHDGYLIDEGVDFVLNPRNYKIGGGGWSPASLAELKIGASMVRPGVRYTVVAPQVLQIQPLVGRSSQRALSLHETRLLRRPPAPTARLCRTSCARRNP